MKNILLLFAILIACQAVSYAQTPKVGSKKWFEESRKGIEEEKLFGLAMDKRLKNNHVGATKDYTKILKLNPKSTWAYLYRGSEKAILKDYKGAIDDYNKAIQIDSVFAFAYLDRGKAKAMLMDYNGAIDDYNKAIEIDAAKVAEFAYFNRGKAKFALGDKNGACLDWKKALELGDTDANDLIEEHCK